MNASTSARLLHKKVPQINKPVPHSQAQANPGHVAQSVQWDRQEQERAMYFQSQHASPPMYDTPYGFGMAPMTAPPMYYAPPAPQPFYAPPSPYTAAPQLSYVYDPYMPYTVPQSASTYAVPVGQSQTLVFESTAPPRCVTLIDNKHAALNSYSSRYYSTGLHNQTSQADFYNSDAESTTSESSNYMGINTLDFDQLHEAINNQFNSRKLPRLLWLNRLLAKASTALQFDQAVKIFFKYQQRLINTTAETGTLLIKAACRADRPQDALDLLENIESVRVFPTLGGIHYLMINFSLKKDTRMVMRTFDVVSKRHLKPNQRTFHILIRECVDTDLIDEALHYFKIAKEIAVVPNRVTYNILMNGARKTGQPRVMLDMRDEMDKNKIEINDTTVKFTVFAYLMMGDVARAVSAFCEFAELENSESMTKFYDKFFEALEDADADQSAVLLNTLFSGLEERDVKVPASYLQKLKDFEESSKASNVEASETTEQETAPVEGETEAEETTEASNEENKEK